MHLRFPISPLAVPGAAALLTAVLALCGPAACAQTAQDVQKATESCTGPAGTASPECQALKSQLSSGAQVSPGMQISPGARQRLRPAAAPGETGTTPKNKETAGSGEAEEDQGTPVLPPLAPGADRPNEFQRFSAASVGSILPIFGASLFQHVPTTFAPIERVPVTADYVIGPSDEIVLRTWGQVSLDLELTVDRAGAVFVPQAGNLTVAGLAFKQLHGFFKTQLGRVYRNFDLSVSMGQLRSIQVFVVGQARRPGTYTVSSLSTLVNVLFTSGGPTAVGSMRHVQLKRGSAVVSEFDLYDLLLKGDKSKDARLLPGDVVYIPPAGPQVAVAGSVRTAAVYELKDERTVGELVELAGGLAPTADAKRALLERITAQHKREVLELALDGVGQAVAVREADILRIPAISPKFDRAVTLRGNVANPGRFSWHEGLRLRDIIPDKESLITRAYWTQRNRLGATPPGDTDWAEHSRRGFAPLNNAEVANEPRAGGLATLTGPIGAAENKTGTASVPEINWSYAAIERQNPDTLAAQLIPFNLGRLVIDRDESQNLELRPGDVVTIFSTADVHVAETQQNHYVRLEGEFNAAGIYLARPGETLGQLIDRIGGMTPQAYLYGAELTRVSTQRSQQERLDQFVDEMERQLAQGASARTGLGSTGEETQAATAQMTAQRQVLDRMHAIKATGRIVLELDPEDMGTARLMNIPLEDGDTFHVPTRPMTVNVFGAVYNQSALLFRPRHRVADYLSEAGGCDRTADRSRTFVIRADGQVVPKHGSGLFSKSFEATRLNPGDSVVVPTQMFHGAAMRGLRDWTQVFSQLALGAAAVNVLK